MAPQVSKSALINKLKQKSQGAWKEARKVDPKARGGGGFPPSLKNIVAVCRSWKLAETKKGDPFFSLTGIVVEPAEYEGRRATFMWFINDSEYSTAAGELEKLANDLALIYPGEMPAKEEGILDVLKELCDEGVHFLFNTGKERTKGRDPNLFIQGPAEGWENDPTDPNDPNATPSDTAGDTGGATGTDQGGDVGDAPQDAGSGDEGGGEGCPVDCPVDDPDPEVDGEYYYKPTAGKLKGKKVILKVTKVDKKKKLVDGQTVKQKPNLAFKGVKWDQLLGE